MAGTERLPRVTAWVIAITGAIAASTLVVHRPILGAAIFSGMIVAYGIRRFTASIWSVVFATCLVTAGSLGIVVSIGLAGIVTLTDGLVSIPGVIIGIGIVQTLTGETDIQRVSRAGTAVVTGAITTGLLGLAALQIDAAGIGFRSALGSVLWIWGTGGTGFAALSVVTGISLAVALIMYPVGGHSTSLHHSRKERRQFRVSLAGLVVVVLTSVSIILLVLWGIFRNVWLVGNGLAMIVDSVVLRTLLILLLVLAVFGIVLSIPLYYKWANSENSSTALVAYCAGAIAGATIPFIVIVQRGLLDSQPDRIVALYGIAAIVLGIGGLAIFLLSRAERNVTTAGPALLAVGLILTGIAEAIIASRTVQTNTHGVAVLAVLTAGIFAFVGWKYGDRVAVEVGESNVDTTTQLIYLSWTGSVALAGFLLATLLLVLSTTVAPPIAVPSTLGLLAGFGAFLASLWLLLK